MGKKRVGILTSLLHRQSLYRTALALVLVAAVAISLWFAVPTKALNITITNPGSGTLGSTYSFQVKVSIEDEELLPVQNIDLKIYNVANAASYYDNYASLSLATTQGYVLHATSGTGGNSEIRTTAGATWGYSYGYGYALWQGYGYYFFPPTGYGYGYGYQGGTGTTAITYDIKWTPPSGWPQGDYKIETKITANGTTFTQTSTVTLVPTGGGGVIPSPPPPGVTNVVASVDNDGVFTESIAAESEDNNVKLDIAKDTTGQTAGGQPLSEISIIPMEEPPAPYPDTSFISLPYDIGPDGATFDPPITITVKYDPDDIPAGVKEANLGIAIWDEAAGNWIELEGCVVDTVNHTITAPVSHFTTFSVVAHTRPAALTIGSLTISPAEANIGQNVIIRTVVTNDGDLPGSYPVTLKVNGTNVQTKELTLDGGDSQSAVFIITKNTAGTYEVDVNGLTGTFTITTAAEPQPAAFITSNLSISPAEVNIGESATISVLVSNTGDLAGSYVVTLKVNGTEAATEAVTLDGGASQTVTFALDRDIAGTYTIGIEDLSSTLTVRAAEEPEGPNWQLIGAIIASVIIIAVIVILVVLRRRYEQT